MPVAITYQDAGVNIAAGNEAISRIKAHVNRTFSAHVMGGIGGFGAMFDLKAALVNYQHPIMVQSVDGVGTKTIVARMADRFDQLGHDLLSACSNDILVLGAKTLTMLDYIANDKLNPARIEVIVKGISQACMQNKVSLIGGETDEMPNTYLPGEHDLVGIVTGVVEKNCIVDGSSVQLDDIAVGFASSGLHTNGFSLARKLLFEVAGYKIHQRVPKLGCSIADALLAPHINYSRPVHAVLDTSIPIHAMVHITGGGLLENIPRVLPEGMALEIDTHSWTVPPLFELLVKLGQLPLQERYRTLNMGIGYVVILPAGAVADFDAILSAFPAFQCQPIGRVVAGQQDVKLKE